MTDSVEKIFEKSGAVLKGHFLLTSGRHSPVYWEKAQVLQYPEYAEQLCGMIADNFRDSGIQVVAGPTTTGIILAYEVARQLGVRSIFAEKEDTGERTFRRGFHISPDEQVLVVDDILTTGGSIREVMAFPKTQTAACPLTSAPSAVATGQLIELGIHLRKPPKIEE